MICTFTKRNTDFKKNILILLNQIENRKQRGKTENNRQKKSTPLMKVTKYKIIFAPPEGGN
jgi:hypothetical protein